MPTTQERIAANKRANAYRRHKNAQDARFAVNIVMGAFLILAIMGIALDDVSGAVPGWFGLSVSIPTSALLVIMMVVFNAYMAAEIARRKKAHGELSA